MNEMLYNLYMEYWPDMLSDLNNFGLSNPLLLKVKDEEKYKAADLRIMIFGQETNTWNGALGTKSISELLNSYEDFFGDEYCYHYGGYFWNTVKDYKKSFSELSTNMHVEIMWNNIIKLGKESEAGAPNRPLIDMQQKIFPVIKEEIKILKPDLILFFTGPAYDGFIEKEWKDITLSPLSEMKSRELAVAHHKLLPKNTFRTYHPRYLSMRGKDYYTNIKDIIIRNAQLSHKPEKLDIK